MELRLGVKSRRQDAGGTHSSDGGDPIGHPIPVAGKPTNWMKRSVHISGKIEPFFGTLDENVRMLEDLLRVETQLHDSKLTIEGAHDAVEQAVRIVEE